MELQSQGGIVHVKSPAFFYIVHLIPPSRTVTVHLPLAGVQEPALVPYHCMLSMSTQLKLKNHIIIFVVIYNLKVLIL